MKFLTLLSLIFLMSCDPIGIYKVEIVELSGNTVVDTIACHHPHYRKNHPEFRFRNGCLYDYYYGEGIRCGVKKFKVRKYLGNAEAQDVKRMQCN